jgi:hypothetical protein
MGKCLSGDGEVREGQLQADGIELVTETTDDDDCTAQGGEEK